MDFSSPSFFGPKRDDPPFPKRGFDVPDPPNNGQAEVVLPKMLLPVLFEKSDVELTFDPNNESFLSSSFFSPDGYEKLNKDDFGLSSVLASSCGAFGRAPDNLNPP